jgi:hypothetical protein
MMLKSYITERIAINGLCLILSSVIVFHLLVILGVIPFDIVWGGRLKDRSQMVSFELTSILLNLIMLAVVTIKAELIKIPVNKKIIRILLWLMALLFLLNTIGNLLSNNQLEKIIFTPLTFLLSLFSIRLAIGNQTNTVHSS